MVRAVSANTQEPPFGAARVLPSVRETAGEARASQSRRAATAVGQVRASRGSPDGAGGLRAGGGRAPEGRAAAWGGRSRQGERRGQGGEAARRDGGVEAVRFRRSLEPVPC